jgi:tripartite-type tricarboxylate transporter receptor subunit TctC
MSFARRHLLQLAGAAVVASAPPQLAFAFDYPTRAVRWIVPYAAGSAPDIVARLLGQWLTERLGQAFVIENRPGAGGNIGTEAVVRAPADGYMLLSVAAGSMISPSLYPKLNFDFIRDIAPVASLIRVPHVVAVHPLLPVTSISELISFARVNPGRLTEGSLTGASVHLASELFKMMTGVNIVHVPYRSGVLTDLLSGELQVSFDTATLLAESIRAGKLRAIAVTTATRWEGLPDVPTVGEFVPGYEVSSAGGIGVPKNTAPEIIEKLNKEINAGLANDSIRARLANLGATTLPGSPANFAQLIASETEKWARVIKFAGPIQQ